MEASITLKNISKHFEGKYVIRNLNFGIEKGSIFAIIGRNRAGKSVLLKILSTITPPDNGTIYIKDQTPKTNRKIKNSIGFLPDHDIHDPWLTGRENLIHRIHLLGLDETKAKSELTQLLQEFEIEDEVDNYPVTYSKGVKRRLDIVQTLVGNPEILIFDEPLMGLDHHARKILLNYLLKVKGEKTVVIASHEFTEIQTIADRWIVLHEGKIMYDGTIDKMLEQYATPFTVDIELKNKPDNICEELEQLEEVRKVEDFGKTIKVVINRSSDFCNVLNKINLENIIGLSGYLISLNEFIDRLTSDESY